MKLGTFKENVVRLGKGVVTLSLGLTEVLVSLGKLVLLSVVTLVKLVLKLVSN